MSKAALNSPCYILEKTSKLRCVWHWWNLLLCWWIRYKVFRRYYNPLEQLRVNLWAISFYVKNLFSIIICDRILRYPSLHSRGTLWNTYRIICNSHKVILWPIAKLFVHDSFLDCIHLCRSCLSSQMFAETSCRIVSIISKLSKVTAFRFPLWHWQVRLFLHFSFLHNCSKKVFFSVLQIIQAAVEMSLMTAQSDLVWESRRAIEMTLFAYHTPDHS